MKNNSISETKSEQGIYPIESSSAAVGSLEGRTVNALETTKNRTQKILWIAKAALGLYLGMYLSKYLTNTGVKHYIHEVLGHGLLGTIPFNYDEAQVKMVYQIDGIDNFKQILRSKDFCDLRSHFEKWLNGYDFHQDKARGQFWIPPRHLNQIGLKVFKNLKACEAWLSLCGSLSELIFDVAIGIKGLSEIKKRPFCGALMLTTSIQNHLRNSLYPIGAASFSNEKLLAMGNESGHDFASFANNVANLTDTYPKAVAEQTASIFLASLPLFILGNYLYQNSGQSNIVDDQFAFRKWLEETKEKKELEAFLEKAWQSYPQKTEDAEADKKSAEFIKHCTELVPKNWLDGLKKWIFDRWKFEKTKYSETEKIADYASKAFYYSDFFTRTNTNALSSAISPLIKPLGAICVITDAKKTYLDCKNPRITRSAKMIQVAKSIVSALSVGALCSSPLDSGLSVHFLALQTISFFASNGLSNVYNALMKREFRSQNHHQI